MTMTSILIVSAIVSAFLLFAGVLAWGDFYSRRRPGGYSSIPDQAPAATNATPEKWRNAA